MSDDADAGLVEHARDAAARGDWQNAFDLLTEADADGLLPSGELPVLGEVAYAAGHLDVAIEAWSALMRRASRPVNKWGPPVRPSAVAMHLLFDTALMAPVRGWLARAERLLEGAQVVPVHAWFAVVRAYERMLSGDVPGARKWARRAIEVGSTCDPAACAIGRIAEARLVILAGEIQQGLALLDEAGVATVSGSSMYFRRGWSTASWCVPCKGWLCMTRPNSGPRRWSGGVRRMPSAACTGVAGCTAPRSSGCAGRATRRSVKR